jgi:hypothetical protein
MQIRISRNQFPGPNKYMTSTSRLLLPTPISFSSAERYQQERARSPGPIYDPKYQHSSFTPSLDSPGRTLSGSIYEFGYSNKSPGPAYSTEKEFLLLSTYLSATSPKFGREPHLAPVDGIERKILDQLDPLSDRRSSSSKSRRSIVPLLWSNWWSIHRIFAYCTYYSRFVARSYTLCPSNNTILLLQHIQYFEY